MSDTEPNNSPWPRQPNSYMYEPFSFTLGAGLADTETAQTTPQNPERWAISIGAAAGVQVQVYVNATASGRFITLYGGGKATIPGDNGIVSFRNVGANAARIVAIAVRGYGFVDVDCGEVP